MLAIIEQFAHIVVEAAMPISDEHAQRLEEQADFVAVLHEQAVDTILAMPEQPQVSSANACMHVAAPASCCHELQGLGVAN